MEDIKKNMKLCDLRVDDLTAFDQLHYDGTTSLDRFISFSGTSSEDSILDIGSGIGGPARYLADRAGCHVTGIDLQADLVEISRDLTARCGLSDKVNFVVGDFLAPDIDYPGRFRGIVSLFCFLHIKDKEGLMKKCFDCTTPGGTLYIEDYYAQRPLNVDDVRILKDENSSERLSSEKEYIDIIAEAGYTDIQFTNKSDEWRYYVSTRIEKFVANKPKFVATHGSDTYENRHTFYLNIAKAYNDGNVGGCLIKARKPL